jgi:iron-sulfur cluster assembly protein
MDLIITDKAAEEILKQPHNYLRIGIKGGGCSGFSYVLQFSNDPISDRDVVFLHNNAKIVVDVKSLSYLKGSTLDWQKSFIKQGFIIKNPNEASKCGCGNSFSIK